MPHNTNTTWPPDAIPVLSRGKHRRPRRGACFMELASYMAGEPWSDHPACTHPALATLARDVNDYTTDDNRTRLAPLIPSVIDVRGDDPLVDVRIALRAATAALPIAAEDRQRVLAVGILRCEQELTAAGGTPSDGTATDAGLLAAGQRALDAAPLAAEWARRFMGTSDWHRTRARRRPYPGIIHHAVRGIAEACVHDPDDVLHRLLTDAIADCSRTLTRVEAAPADVTVTA